MIFSILDCGLSIKSLISWKENLPISYRGWRTVVSGWSRNSQRVMSSNPMTEISFPGSGCWRGFADTAQRHQVVAGKDRRNALVQQFAGGEKTRFNLVIPW